MSAEAAQTQTPGFKRFRRDDTSFKGRTVDDFDDSPDWGVGSEDETSDKKDILRRKARIEKIDSETSLDVQSIPTRAVMSREVSQVKLEPSLMGIPNETRLQIFGSLLKIKIYEVPLMSRLNSQPSINFDEMTRQYDQSLDIARILFRTGNSRIIASVIKILLEDHKIVEEGIPVGDWHLGPFRKHLTSDEIDNIDFDGLALAQVN